jgi:cytoskeletal protein CcmA (bactofilin family)
MSSIRRVRAFLPLLLLVVPLLVVTASGAAAQVTDPGEANDVFGLNGGVQIAPGEEVGDVVVVNGPVTVQGTALGDVFVLNGATTIAGEVTGDVVVVNGAVSVNAGARIGGDLVTGSGTTSISPDATIQGEVRSVDFGFIFGRAAIVGAILVWLAVSLSALTLGMLFLLIAPRAAEAIASAAQSKVGPVIGWGFAMFFGIPIGAGIAIATLVGIPLGVSVLLSLPLLYPFGGIASAWALGRALLKPPTSRFVSFLLGWAILAGASLIPFLGGFVWLAAIVYGLGSIAVAVWGARKAATPVAPSVMPSAMPPPPTV